MKRGRLIVSGFLQGVGFRMFAERTAVKPCISGWIRSLPEGTVEIEAQGPEQHLEKPAKQASKRVFGSRG
ncbi:acylphosphatase [Chlorobium sp.]|uniref:acylphosphatase n=1 Tax=Chlorobium sp. TaxID=1095 RepID=UPI002F408238